MPLSWHNLPRIATVFNCVFAVIAMQHFPLRAAFYGAALTALLLLGGMLLGALLGALSIQLTPGHSLSIRTPHRCLWLSLSHLPALSLAARHGASPWDALLMQPIPDEWRGQASRALPPSPPSSVSPSNCWNLLLYHSSAPSFRFSVSLPCSLFPPPF